MSTALPRRLAATLALLVSAAALAPPSAASQDDHQRQVLVVYSTRRDAQVALIGERDIPRILEDGLDRHLDYYAEFVDPARFSDASYQQALSTFLRHKYEEHHFEIIIAIGDDAAAFVGKYRADVFEGAPPLVYYGTSIHTPRPPNSTGIVGEVFFKPTVLMARALDPQLRYVYVVTGADPNDRKSERQARAELTGLDGMEVTYFGGLRTADLEDKLRRLPAHSMVFYIIVDVDGAGEYFHPLRYLDRVVAAANAPTYSWVDSAMGHGIVGGHLKSQAAQIRAVSELALRVLRGDKADTIPVSGRDLNVDQVDWRQVQRWGLDASRLPVATSILFRERTLWERYRTYLLAAALVLVGQSVLIGGLLVQRRRRRRAEEDLRDSQDRLRVSYDRIRDLGARLLRTQEKERAYIARELHDDVSQQLALIAMDLKMIGGEPAAAELAGETLARVHDVCRSIRDLSHRLHPAKLRLIGLVVALNGLQAESAQSGVEVVFTHEQVPAGLPSDVTVALFRVAQEALQNALKHSGAQRVTLNLSCRGGDLVLTIADNGVGFDVPAVWGRGLGLVSMMERVDALGGDIQVLSEPGRGTQLQVSVPVNPTQSGSIAV